LAYSNENKNTIRPFRYKKYSYLSRVVGYNMGISKFFLIKSLINKDMGIFDGNLYNNFRLPLKHNIANNGLFNLKFLIFLRNRVYKSGYASLKHEMTTLDIVSNKLKNFFKLNKSYFYLNVSHSKFGSFYKKQQRFNFIEISKRKKVQFIQKLPTCFKKSTWLFNSFEVTNSSIISFNKNI